jgi:hypothetical protein
MKERSAQTRRIFLTTALAAGLYAALPEAVLASRPEARSELNAYEAFLQGIVAKRPRVARWSQYNQSLKEGLGFSTWSRRLVRACSYWGKATRQYMDERGLAYEDLTASQRNIFDITQDGKKSIRASLVDQSSLSPLEAFQSGQYVGLMANRAPLDRGRRYAVYRVNSPDPATRPEFLGVALTVDCASKETWERGIPRQTYNFLGWKGLEWVVESSALMHSLLPTGYSGNPKKLYEGRPGALLVSEDTFHFYSNLMKLGIQ